MTRTVPAPDQAEASKQYASEPLLIAEIEWSGGTLYYATKTLGNGDGSSVVNAIGTIMSIENFSEQIKVGVSGKINNISMQLAGVRSYYDSNVIQGTKCTVYQYFIDDAGDLTTGTLMFKGKIASPISWSEETDQLSFDVISNIPDSEYGFALDSEGSYGYTPDDDAFDVPWPIVFGKCLNVPAVRIQSGIVGKITEPVNRTTTTFEIEDGDRFASETLRILIGKVVHTITFDGTTTATIDSINLARYSAIDVVAGDTGDDDEDNYAVVWLDDDDIDVKGSYLYSSALKQYNYCYRQEVIGISTKVWCTHKWGSFTNQIWSDTRPTVITETAGAIRDSWTAPPMNFVHSYIIKTDSSVYQLNADGTIHVNSLVRYVAGLYADTVLDVKAFRTIDKKKILCNVPSSYYTKAAEDIGAGFNSTTITMDQLLSSRDREGWDDDLFVSLAGVQTKNTSMAIIWLLDTYSGLGYNTASFIVVAAKLLDYPSNFVLFDQGDTLKICEEIAWQARCTLKVVDETVSIMYLSQQPSPSIIINDDDFEIKTTQLSLTDETELITKFVANWKESYSTDDTIKNYTLKQNIDSYGLIKQEFDFWIYNLSGCVEHSADFWAHRYANIWKLVSFDSFMDNMGLEALDSVMLEATSHNIVTEDVRAIVENISIEQARGLIRLDLWLSVIVGTQTEDEDAWIEDGSVSDIDVSGLSEYDYEVELEEASEAANNSVNLEGKIRPAIPHSIEGWTLIATTLEDMSPQNHVHCSIDNIDAAPWVVSRVPDYIIGEPVKHGSILAVCRQSHDPDLGNQPVIGGNAYWYDCDDVEVEFTQPNPALKMKDMEHAFIGNMNINISFANGIFIYNGLPHPETLAGRVMQFKCTTDASTQKFISAKLTQFDYAPAWAGSTHMRRHQFTTKSSRLFECLVPHNSSAGSEPISGGTWTYYWTEWTTDNIYFEIKGANNLDDLSEPLVTNDLITAKYDIYNDQWNAVDTLYEGGSGGGESGWFKLTDIALNPMTGRQQTCDAGSFSEASDTDIDIYKHPGSDLEYYGVDDYVFANYVGNCWVSVSMFSSFDEFKDAVGNVFKVCEE